MFFQQRYQILKSSTSDTNVTKLLQNERIRENDSEKRKNFGVKFLLCFSLYTNGKKLLNTKKSAGTIGKSKF